jgi:hypothetical protein
MIDVQALIKLEIWFAPALNFLPVKIQYVMPSGDDVTETLKNLKAGIDPDSALFRIPPDFKIVH